MLASNSLFPQKLRASLALRSLERGWQQYREDRAIALGEHLVGAECASERNAFLGLVVRTLPSRSNALAEAVRLVQTIAIRPLAAEARQCEGIITESLDDLAAAANCLGSPQLPDDPLQRLWTVVDRLRYSTGPSDNALSATAHTPCWAVNLLGLVSSASFGLIDAALSPAPRSLGLPLPGLVDRRAFRADWSQPERRDVLRRSVARALDGAASDIAATLRAREAFAANAGNLQANSRAYPAWLILTALRGLTPAQLARALGVTKAGSGKILQQLGQRGMVQCDGGYGPYRPVTIPMTLPIATTITSGSMTDMQGTGRRT